MRVFLADNTLEAANNTAGEIQGAFNGSYENSHLGLEPFVSKP